MIRSVSLTTWEIMLASQAGVMRQVENLKHNRKPAYGAGELNDWQLHIEGALGEYALAKFLGVHWSGKGILCGADVGDMDVRTRSKPNYDLILHDRDACDRKFWLLTGRNGEYVVRGWILGRDGKQQRFLKDPAGGRQAYFVPQSELQF